MSQQPKDRPFKPNDPKNPKKPKKPLGLIRKPSTPKPAMVRKPMVDSVIPLTRVIFERSKNVKRKQADLANKIDRRGGPKSSAEAGVVGRENARQEGLAGNKEYGKAAKRRMQNSNTAYPLTADRVFMFEGKYKDQRMAAERGEAKGALRGPIAQAAIRRLKGSKGKKVGGKLKPATSKAARQSYRNAARSEAGTSRPVKAPEDSLPHPKGGIAGSTEDIQNQIARRGHSR